MPSGGITWRTSWTMRCGERKPVFCRPLGEAGKDAFAQTQQSLAIGELAFQAIGEGGEARTDIADDLRLREVYLFHRRRRGADMDHLRSITAHQERRLLDGVVADRNDQIGLVDRLMNPIPLRQCGRAHIEIGAGIDRALPHLGVEERNPASPHERRQRLGKMRAARRAAQHDERPAGNHDHGCGALDGRCRRDRKLDDVRGNDVGRGFVGRDILGQFEMHGARPLLLRDPEGVANQGRNTLRGDDLRRHLGERPHGRDDVDDLEAGLAAAADRLLSGDHDHRHRAEMRVGRSRRQIERTGTERRQADARAPGETPVGGCHEAGSLFVPRQHQLDLRAPQRVQHIEILLAGNGEDVPDALILKGGHQQIGGLCHAAEAPLAPVAAFSARCGKVHSGRMK